MAQLSEDRNRHEDVFISAGVNRASHSADWTAVEGPNGQSITVLAYGSSSSIAIAYNLGSNQTGLSDLIPTPFDSAVTTLKFMRWPSASGSVALVAAAGKGQAAVWVGDVVHDAQSSTECLWKPVRWTLAYKIGGQGKSGPLKKSHTVQANDAVSQKQQARGTVQALGVQRRVSVADQLDDSDSSEMTIAIGTSDGTIEVWSIASNDQESMPQLKQTLSSAKLELNGALPLDIAITLLPSTDASLLMAVACTDRKISFWTRDRHEQEFRRRLVLGGHDDWVRSLDFTVPFSVASTTSGDSNEQLLTLASASQDASVRLWRVRRTAARSTESLHSSGTAPANDDAFEQLAKKVEDEASGEHSATSGAKLSSKSHHFETATSGTWTVTFDALLTGHEGWVTGVRWVPSIVSRSGAVDQPAALISSSADNSVILWTPSGSRPVQTDSQRLSYPSLGSDDATSSLWLPSQRFGELGVAGAGALGMFGALWNPVWHQPDGGQMILSHAWAGAVHLWRHDETTRQWRAVPAVTAHSLPVQSARWSANGLSFLTSSLDRTARVFSQHASALPQKGSISSRNWHELARPQTHGYDIRGAAWLDDLAFVSAAEEKVARIFAAPQSFIETADRLNTLRPQSTVASKKRNLLVLELPTADSIRDPQPLADAVRTASQETCQSRHQKLIVLLSSPLFDSICRDADGVMQLAFKDVESLLRWTYAQAWSVAVQQHAFLLDVDVLLVGSDKLESTVSRFGSAGQGCDTFWAVDSLSALLGKIATAASQAGVKLVSPVFLPPSQSLTSSSTTKERDESPFPRHRTIALGGTFDHLHVGHKILLSIAALIATKRVIVGVTGGSMLAKKSNPELLETTTERLAAVDHFVSTFRDTLSGPLEQSIVELQDVCGPAGTEEDLQAMLLTDETISGGDMIAKTRQDRGLSALKRYVIGVVGAGGETDVKGNDAAELAAAKVGSTAIRRWLSQEPLSVQCQARRRTRALTDTHLGSDMKPQGSHSFSAESRPASASVPALGLSNRAVFEGGLQEMQVDDMGRPVAAIAANPVANGDATGAARPLVEEELLVSTLWPELDKLYGHGYELLCVDASPGGGRFVATSCRATSSEHCVVRIYDAVQKWKQVAILPGHTLSITRIRFSPNAQWVLTTSRDRTWRLFSLSDSKRGSGPPSLEAKPLEHGLPESSSQHTRIVWDAAWADDGLHFATASRDRSVKVWRLAPQAVLAQNEVKRTQEDTELPSGANVQLVASLIRLPEAATSVAFDSQNRLAVGLDNGTVLLYQFATGEKAELKLLLSLPGHHSAGPVNELAWRPLSDDEVEASRTTGLLLSGGEDGAVRLTRFHN